MFCPKCGTKFQDGQQYCMVCGTKLQIPPELQQQSDQPAPQATQQQVASPQVTQPQPTRPQVTPARSAEHPSRQYHAEDIIADPDEDMAGQGEHEPQHRSSATVSKPNRPANQPSQRSKTESKPNLPLNWFKFVIYFGMWAWGFASIASGVIVFTGGHYNLGDPSRAMTDLIYEAFPRLSTFDHAFGAGMIIVGVMLIVTRFKLAAFREKGYDDLFTWSVLYLVAEGGYIGSLLSLTNASVEPEGILGMIFILVVFGAMNVIYFKRRKQLFNKK